MAVEEDVFTTSSYSITSLTGTAVTIKLSGSWIAKQINGNLGPGVFIVNKASGGVINATVSYASMSGTTTATITGEGLSPETEYAIPECAGFIFYDNSRLDIPTRIEFTTASVTPTEDESYLNERGLAHFWENIDTLKQDKLTAGNYSTSEQDTKFTWTNGAKIYKKTIVSTNLVAGENNINHGISNLGLVLKYDGFMDIGSGTTLPIPTMASATNNSVSVWTVNSTIIRIFSSLAFTGKVYITLYYTKT